MEIIPVNELKEIEMPRAILVGINCSRNVEGVDIEVSMKELEELTKAAGAEVLSIVIQNRPTIDPAYYIGKGKVEEIGQLCQNIGGNLVIFNDELSGSQIRNLEGLIGVDVIDRTTLILDIFAQRAKTKEGKLQVELAQLKYRLPRLIGLGEKLSRQGAGIGTRGPGEMKLETDRRHILRRIDYIKEELKEVKKNREVQRAKRIKSGLPIVALVGYTNAGKSTLLNSLLKMSEGYSEEREVYVKDMLFATLDVSLRKLSFPDHFEFLLTDTVGFVSKLPHHLVDSFKATLEEVKYADLLLHVMDTSNENYHLQRETTLRVLKELGVEGKKIIHVYNKMDKVEDITCIPREENVIFISATTGRNLDQLIELIKKEIGSKNVEIHLMIPYNKGNILSQLHKEGMIMEQEYTSKGISVRVKLPSVEYAKYKEFEIMMD